MSSVFRKGLNVTGGFVSAPPRVENNKRQLKKTSRISRGSCGGSAAPSMDAADEPHHFAEDGHLGKQNGLHEVIFRLKADIILFLVKALHGGLFIRGHGHDDVAVVRGGLLPDDDVVLVEDAGIDHAVPLYGKDEMLAVAHHFFGKGNVFLNVFHGGDDRKSV